MIPVVADALLEVIQKNGLEVEYVRNSREPMFPFLKKGSFYKTYRPVNFVKNMILHFCSFLLEGKFRKIGT